MNVRFAPCPRLFVRACALVGGLLAAAALAFALMGAAPSMALAQEQPHQQDTPNSWRYADGVLICDQLPSELPNEGEGGEGEPSFIPWSKTPEGFINPEGNIIEGALRKGVDVSRWNQDIDWAKVKADGIEFAIIRCGYGSDYDDQDDEFFFENVAGCLENGIDFGVYIYSYAFTEDMARSEAAHVLRLLEEAGLTPADLKYSVYLDVEESGGKDVPCIRDIEYVENEDGDLVSQYVYHYLDPELLGKLATAFATEMEAAGYEVGFYANLNWWNNHMTDPVFDNYERWVAQWNYTCDYEGDYSVWQYTSNGSVDGIRGIVDTNFDYDPSRAAQEPPAPMETYVISATASPAEGGTVTGAGEYEEGATVTVEAAAAEGYKFVKWMANDAELSTDASYVFTASENLDLVAVFEVVASPTPEDPGDGDEPEGPEGGEGDNGQAPEEPGDGEDSKKPGASEPGKSEGGNTLAATGDSAPVTALIALAVVSFAVALVARKRCI